MSAARDVANLAALYGEPERQLPVSVTAEQSVLGGLLLTPSTLPRVSDWLAEGDFFRGDHRAIYRGILALAEQGKPFDWVTLAEWAEAQGLDDEMGRAGYIAELASTTPSSANLVAYAEIVVEHSRLRQAIALSAELADRAYRRGASADEVAAFAQSSIAGLAPTRHTGLQESKPGLRNWWAAVMERVDAPGLLGLPTPWREVNQATKGLRPGRVYVIAGRPGMGKSVVGCQLAAFAALRGTRTALFSLEMSAEEVHQRNVSALSGVPHDFLEEPVKDSEHWSRLNVAIADLTRAPLLVDDTPALTANQLAARAERAHLQSGLGLVVVDHLHEMSVDARDRVNAIGDAARRLKGLAKHLNVPVVLLAQLNRESAKNKARPTLNDLRASGSIEEVADVVLLLHREDYYHPDTHLKGVVEVIVAKGRNIRSGMTVNLQADLGCMRFLDWEGSLPTAPQPTAGSQGGWGSRNRDGKRAAGGDA